MMSNGEWRTTLEIRNPVAECGHCGFATQLTGVWSVERGRLVFRAALDPQPRRGPDLNGCSESDPYVHFKHVTVDGEHLRETEIEDLKDSMRAVQAIGDLYDDPVRKQS